MTAETQCADMRTHSISVDADEKACINCIYFEQHYRPMRYNVKGYVPTSKGKCHQKQKERGALQRPCKQFETQERSTP